MDQVSFSADQFHAIVAPKVNMIEAGGGINLWVLGVLVTLKALGNETGGTYAVFEDRVPPGSGPPPHIHTLEDESWYMLEGELIWLVGGKEFHAKPGSFIHLPRFVPHTFENRFDKTAVMVLNYAPGGLENWFLQVGKRVQDPAEAPPRVSNEERKKAVELMKEYGVIYAGNPEQKQQSSSATI
ncbi:hypothetical protein O6H91_17G025600 [Diphasiastrum complanatum]|nr:hypothetical protein O6H91_17G025600 [Diphasiastrum complanatum]